MFWVIFLYACGIGLLLTEVFVPGLICGIIGGALIIASAVYGAFSFPDYGLWIVLLEFLGGFVTVVVGLALFPKSPAGKRLILANEMTADDGWVAEESDLSLVDQIGEAFTPLRPAGTVMVGDKRVSAVTSGSFIEQGKKVRIIEVRGSRIVVEEAAM